MSAQVEKARLASARHLQEEGLEGAREANRVARERLRLEHELALQGAEAESALVLARERARVKADEEVTLARQSSERRVAEAQLERSREAHRAEIERIGLEQAVALERQEQSAPVRRRTLELDHETADLALDAARRARDLRALEAEAAFATDRARTELEARILPIRQVPEIADALSQALQGADLSIYGADHALTAILGPLLDRLAHAVAGAHPAAAPRAS